MKPEEGKMYVIDFNEGKDRTFHGIATCTGALLYTDEVLYGFNQLKACDGELHKYMEDSMEAFLDAQLETWFAEKCIQKEVNDANLLEVAAELRGIVNNYSEKHAEVNYYIFEIKNGLLLRPKDEFDQNIFSAYGYITMEMAQEEILKYANRTDRNRSFFILPEVCIIEKEIVK